MLELPELTPEYFEILVVRELRKIGLEVSQLRVHRRSTLPEPDQGYLLELKGSVRRPPWQRRALIACWRRQVPLGPVDVAAARDHVREAGSEVAIVFSTSDVARDALPAAALAAVALLRVTDGRTAFDTSGWGTPGHYPAWLPAYCAQAVLPDALGEPRYQLLESGRGDVIVQQLSASSDTAAPREAAPGERPPAPA
jgi:hypothetical protein